MKKYNKVISTVLLVLMMLSLFSPIVEIKAMENVGEEIVLEDEVKDIIEDEEKVAEENIENIDEIEDDNQIKEEEINEEINNEEELEIPMTELVEAIKVEEMMDKIDYSEGVSNREELNDAIDIANAGDVITLREDYIFEDIEIPMPDKEIIIDGQGINWNKGTIKISNGENGKLIIRNLSLIGQDGAKIVNDSNNGSLVLEDMEVLDTKAPLAFGGSSTTEIYRSRFDRNTSGNRGSAISIGQNAYLKIVDSTFENGISTGGGYEGGVISSKQHAGTIDIENSVFRNNENKITHTGVFGGGGGVISFNQFRGTLNIKDSIFEGNKTNGSSGDVRAGYDGGAIYIFDGTNGGELNIDNTTFNKNIAYDDGGAIMVQVTGNAGFTTTITNSTFYGNNAYGLSGGNKSGGAIQFFKNGGQTVMTNHITDSTFVNNESGSEKSTVNQQGGAIGLSGSSFWAMGAVTPNRSLFVGNKVYGSDGQVDENSRYKDISNSTMINTGETNVINTSSEIDVKNILGSENPELLNNYSNVVAGVDSEVVKTIAIRPEGIANNSNDKLGGLDQRGFKRNNDNGAIQISWIKYDANGGEFKLEDLNEYDGKIYYEREDDGRITMFYQIKYVDANGSILDGEEDLKVENNNLVFKGWSTNKDAGKDEVEFNTNDSINFEDTTVYAVWAENNPNVGKYFKVEYLGNGNTSGTAPIDSKEYDKDEVATVLGRSDLARSGYSFNGWNTKSDGSGENYNIGSTFNITKNISLYAKWTIDNTNPGPNPEPGPGTGSGSRPRPNPGTTNPVLPGDELATLDEGHESYLEGYEDGSVRADGEITRAEVAAIMYRIMPEDRRISMNSKEYKFTDKSYNWSKEYISTLANGEIIKGYPDGTFRPNDSITRAEVVAMIRRYNNLDEGVNPYKDAISHWAEKHIGALSKLNWIEGYEDSTFRPESKITRAEFATIINRMLNRGVSKENIPTNEIAKFNDLQVNKWYYEEIVEAANSHNFIREDEEVRQSEVWVDVVK